MLSIFEKGKKGEEIAERFLRDKGYSILKKRFRSRYGEIDLIGVKDKEMVFIEVKYRKKSFLSLESISSQKMERIQITANIFLQKNPILEKEYPFLRFDVIITSCFKVVKHLEGVWIS